jgi:hypothetical protein
MRPIAFLSPLLGLLLPGAPADAATRGYSVISFDRLIVTGPYDVAV